jgi:cytochrome bd-type quinol oxidase subunit 2
MSLSKSEIEYLQEFVENHYIEWYDLQIELVDHLANEVESLMKKNKNLTFKEAVNKAFSKFGPMGFMQIAENKTVSIQKTYLRNILQEFKHLFLSHKIMGVIFSVGLLYQFIMWFPNKTWIVFFVYLLILSIPLYNLLKIFIKIRKKKKKREKRYLVENVIIQSSLFLYTTTIIPLTLNSILKITDQLSKNKWQKEHYLIFSIVIVILFYLYYFSFFTIPKRMISKVQERYKILYQGN